MGRLVELVCTHLTADETWRHTFLTVLARPLLLDAAEDLSVVGFLVFRNSQLVIGIESQALAGLVKGTLTHLRAEPAAPLTLTNTTDVTSAAKGVGTTVLKRHKGLLFFLLGLREDFVF
jgi:hypothetical protein